MIADFTYITREFFFSFTTILSWNYTTTSEAKTLQIPHYGHLFLKHWRTWKCFYVKYGSDVNQYFSQAKVILLTSMESLFFSPRSGSEIGPSVVLFSSARAVTAAPGAVKGTWDERRSHGVRRDNGGWVSSFAGTSITLFFYRLIANTAFIDVVFGNKATCLQLVQTCNKQNYFPHLIIHTMAHGVCSSFDRKKNQWIINILHTPSVNKKGL